MSRTAAHRFHNSIVLVPAALLLLTLTAHDCRADSTGPATYYALRGVNSVRVSTTIGQDPASVLQTSIFNTSLMSALNAAKVPNTLDPLSASEASPSAGSSGVADLKLTASAYEAGGKLLYDIRLDVVSVVTVNGAPGTAVVWSRTETGATDPTDTLATEVSDEAMAFTADYLQAHISPGPPPKPAPVVAAQPVTPPAPAKQKKPGVVFIPWAPQPSHGE